MREEERARIARLLRKEEGNEETRAAATRDLTLVAAEYFEVFGTPTLTVEKGKEGYFVNFSFHASRVRTLTALPDHK